jgi:hypothetical protein
MKLSAQAKRLIDSALRDPKQRVALEKYMLGLEASVVVGALNQSLQQKEAAKDKRMNRAALFLSKK